MTALLVVMVMQPVWSSAKRQQSQSSRIDQLREYVEFLAAKLPARSPQSDALKASADYIHGIFNRYGSSRLQGYDVPGDQQHCGGRFYNVVVEFGPGTGQPIIIGAHYDSFDGLPGADDNASGVAGLLELARMLAGTPLQSPVHLVAYALEEPPHYRTPYMGSMQHAANLHGKKQAPAFMISLEMIGYFDTKPGSQTYPLALMDAIYPKHGDFIAVVGNMKSLLLTRRFKKAMLAYARLPVYSINAPSSLVGVDFSDHASYWAYGFPAIMITDTAFYRNQAYHTSQDTPDRLNYTRMAQVVEAVFGAVVGMANAGH